MTLMLNLPIEVEQRLQSEARKHGLEADEYVLRLIERQLPTRESSAKKEALEKIFADMEEGLPMGGPPYPSREEIYEERTGR